MTAEAGSVAMPAEAVAVLLRGVGVTVTPTQVVGAAVRWMQVRVEEEVVVPAIPAAVGAAGRPAGVAARPRPMAVGMMAVGMMAVGMMVVGMMVVGMMVAVVAATRAAVAGRGPGSGHSCGRPRHSGTLPCVRRGSSSRLVASIRRPATSF